jgi:hypothetical protein
MSSSAKLNIPADIRTALDDGGQLVISISGGKDSDALCELLVPLAKTRGWNVSLIHADLGQAEWPQTTGYVQRRADELGVPLTLVRRRQGDLLSEIQERARKRPDAPPFPSSAARYCTSDQKRTPIDAALRHIAPSGSVVCAIGLRAEESRQRAKKPIFQVREQITTQLRRAYDWHPLLTFTLEEVWASLGVTLDTLHEVQTAIKAKITKGASLEEAIANTSWNWHPAYTLGNQRLSCALCILASRSDLFNGAQYNPIYYQELVQVEIQSGFSFRQDLRLSDLRPDLLTVVQREALQNGNGKPREQLVLPNTPVQMCLGI